MFLLCSLLLFSFPHEANAGFCNGTSASLNSSTYSGTVGSTFSVIFTFAYTGPCSGSIQDNTGGSFATVPNTDTDLDCNTASCSGFATSPKTATLRCVAAGTYTIRGNISSALSSSNSTVTCKAKSKSIIGLPGNYLTLSSGLVGYWPFDGKTTNWATGKTNDLSGNANTGQLINMSTTTSPVAGKIGGALKFNGSTRYVSEGTSISNIQSVAFWVKVTILTNQGLLGFGGAAYIKLGTTPILVAGSGFTPHIFYIDGIASSSPGLHDSSWHHVVVTTTTAITGNPIEIGRAPDSHGGFVYLHGTLDDVRIYNRALSPSEVQALYHLGAANVAHSNTTALSSGLVGYWTFDGGATHWDTGKVDDVSGQGNTGQLINMSTTTSPTPGKIGQALKFNGSTSYISEPTSISNIRSVAFWAKATTGVSQGLINLTGSSVYISTNASSVISGTGFTSPTYYVDGLASTTHRLYDANWHRIVVTGTAAITGSQITFGRANSVYFKGILDDVRVYNRALSASEVRELYSMGR